MKVNDQVPVFIAGQVVAQASVKELSDGTATLVVPATLVVMATRTELTAETPNRGGSGVETIIDGVERTNQTQSAVGNENQPIDNSTSTETTETASAEASTEGAANSAPETQEVAPAAPVNNDAVTAQESKPEAADE